MQGLHYQRQVEDRVAIEESVSGLAVLVVVEAPVLQRATSVLREGEVLLRATKDRLRLRCTCAEGRPPRADDLVVLGDASLVVDVSEVPPTIHDVWDGGGLRIERNWPCHAVLIKTS